jgi:hypothetical protein
MVKMMAVKLVMMAGTAVSRQIFHAKVLGVVVL